MIFVDRKEAGRLLAQKLVNFKESQDLLVLGLPRGGVVVAKEVADFLDASLDIVVTRKIGHPENSEFAIASVDQDGILTFGLEDKGEYESYMKSESEKQKAEIRRRLKEYRGAEDHADFEDKVCILIDDGLATGLTMRAAIHFLRKRGAAKVIMAVPTIPFDLLDQFSGIVDEMYYLESPKFFFAVGQAYENFPQVEDEEVKEILGLV